jgi:hypothetical protein
MGTTTVFVGSVGKHHKENEKEAKKIQESKKCAWSTMSCSQHA